MWWLRPSCGQPTARRQHRLSPPPALEVEEDQPDRDPGQEEVGKLGIGVAKAAQRTQHARRAHVVCLGCSCRGAQPVHHVFVCQGDLRG